MISFWVVDPFGHPENPQPRPPPPIPPPAPPGPRPSPPGLASARRRE